jgi:hypothetical protein
MLRPSATVKVLLTKWRFADGKYERFPELAVELVD